MKDSRWFMLITTVIAGVIFSFLTLVISGVIFRDKSLGDSIKDRSLFNLHSAEQSSLVFEYIERTNSGSAEDYFTCAPGIIANYPGQKPICTGEFLPGTDEIDDDSDNNDHKPTFYSDLVHPYSFLTPDSTVFDDDAEARIRSFWFVYPGETKTVYAINNHIRNIILANSNNASYLLPSEVNDATMSVDLTNTESWSIEVNIFVIDRELFSQKNSVSVSSNKNRTLAFSGKVTGILDDSINVGWALPYVFDLEKYDYAMNISNTSSGIISYSLLLSRWGLPVYTVPVDDSKSLLRYLSVRYLMEDGKLLYQERMIRRKGK